MVFAVTACAAPEPAEEDDLEYGETTSELRVAGAIGATCSTAIVRGLSKQIAEEVDCMAPASLARLSASTHVRFTSNAVLPYMHPRAKADLLDVAESRTLLINSGYRTVAQQYLLYRWFRAGRCGITAAALPGRSNHETGRAVDLANWSSRVGAMAAHNWAHSVPGDPVHFDNTRSPDNRGMDVRAFQRLWNRNHPDDKITVDGLYGPQTAARLKRAPVKGFTKGASCRAVERGADVLVIDGPDRVASGERAHYAITIANNDEVDWPATTRVIVSGGLASELYDPDSWVSPTEVGMLGSAVPAGGGEGVLELDLRAPVVDAPSTTDVTLALVDGDRLIGTVYLSIIVTPDGDADTSGDAGERHDLEGDGSEELADEDGVIAGGCSAGGGAGWLLALVAVPVTRSRRTRSRRGR